MKDISNKIDTLRTAIAEATVAASPEAVESANTGKTPKGAVWDVARAAGIFAAKKTAELIPYCHQIPIDHVAIEFEPSRDSIRIRASVSAIWKTGVEMEALTAASVAALTVYDMLKPIDSGVAISGVRLIEKTGGKSSFAEESIPSAAVLVVSDSVASGKNEDKSGKLIVEKLESLGVDVKSCVTVPDEEREIAKVVKGWANGGILLIVTTGGTGAGQRDVTVSAISKIIERELPGVAEAVRAYGQRRTPYAMLSRGIAGLVGKTLIVTLPGSPKAVKESMDAIFPHVFHVYPMVEGKGH